MLDFSNLAAALQTGPDRLTVAASRLPRHEIGQFAAERLLAHIAQQLEPGIAGLHDPAVRPKRMQRKRSFAIELAKVLFAFAQQVGLAQRKLPVECGGQQRKKQNQKGDCSDGDRQVGLGETGGAVDRVQIGMRREHRRRHPGIVHPRDGKSHDGRSPDPLPHGDRPERQPQGRDGSSDRDKHRKRDEGTFIAQPCRHAHRRHAGVVHRDDPDSHEQAAERQLKRRRLAGPDHVEADAGHRDGYQERQDRQPEIEADRHRHEEGEHGDEMHRPDAAAHGDRGGRQPAAACPAGRRPDSAGKVERGVGCKGGHRIGQRDQIRVIGPGNGRYRHFCDLPNWHACPVPMSVRTRGMLENSQCNRNDAARRSSLGEPRRMFDLLSICAGHNRTSG